jgi:hypothetical protein
LVKKTVECYIVTEVVGEEERKGKRGEGVKNKREKCEKGESEGVQKRVGEKELE